MPIGFARIPDKQFTAITGLRRYLLALKVYNIWGYYYLRRRGLFGRYETRFIDRPALKIMFGDAVIAQLERTQLLRPLVLPPEIMDDNKFPPTNYKPLFDFEMHSIRHDPLPMEDAFLTRFNVYKHFRNYRDKRRVKKEANQRRMQLLTRQTELRNEIARKREELLKIFSQYYEELPNKLDESIYWDYQDYSKLTQDELNKIYYKIEKAREIEEREEMNEQTKKSEETNQKNELTRFNTSDKMVADLTLEEIEWELLQHDEKRKPGKEEREDFESQNILKNHPIFAIKPDTPEKRKNSLARMTDLELFSIREIGMMKEYKQIGAVHVDKNEQTSYHDVISKYNKMKLETKDYLGGAKIAIGDDKKDGNKDGKEGEQERELRTPMALLVDSMKYMTPRELCRIPRIHKIGMPGFIGNPNTKRMTIENTIAAIKRSGHRLKADRDRTYPINKHIKYKRSLYDSNNKISDINKKDLSSFVKSRNKKYSKMNEVFPAEIDTNNTLEKPKCYDPSAPDTGYFKANQITRRMVESDKITIIDLLEAKRHGKKIPKFKTSSSKERKKISGFVMSQYAIDERNEITNALDDAPTMINHKLRKRGHRFWKRNACMRLRPARFGKKRFVGQWWKRMVSNKVKKIKHY